MRRRPQAAGGVCGDAVRGAGGVGVYACEVVVAGFVSGAGGWECGCGGVAVFDLCEFGGGGGGGRGVGVAVDSGEGLFDSDEEEWAAVAEGGGGGDGAADGFQGGEDEGGGGGGDEGGVEEGEGA